MLLLCANVCLGLTMYLVGTHQLRNAQLKNQVKQEYRLRVSHWTVA